MFPLTRVLLPIEPGCLKTFLYFYRPPGNEGGECENSTDAGWHPGCPIWAGCYPDILFVSPGLHFMI